ncbi:MAG: hypothetical protein COT00_05500, partial [Candidatus Omnitrophica bacterium CG07_land_8_20_14_0_80_50_8]
DQKKISSVFFNLEDPETLRLFNQSDEKLFYLLTHSGKVVFIDEFHYLKNASRLFKAIFDGHKKVKIYASGSSSIEIHKHLKESLTGRRRLISVFPLSYLELKTQFGAKTADHYFQFGGLPGVARESSRQDRIRSLSDIVQAYILKDIKSLVKEENIRAFNTLLYLIAENQGSLVNVDSLAGQIGLTARSVQKYLDIMVHTYVLHILPSFSRNLGNELRKSKKYYLYDLGIRNALLKDFRPLKARNDKGAMMESAVFLNLIQNIQPNEELRFWRTQDGREVDFVLLRDRQPIPIEVKMSAAINEVPAGMRSFLSKYPEAKFGVVFTEATEGNAYFQKIPIYYRKTDDVGVTGRRPWAVDQLTGHRPDKWQRAVTGRCPVYGRSGRNGR